MYRKNSDFLDIGIEADANPKIKFNSLLSGTISTIMCLAAKCPIPKTNVDTTKLFLSTITNENGETPKNIKAILRVLGNYNGPFDTDNYKEKNINQAFDKKLVLEEKEKLCLEYDTVSKDSENSGQIMAKELQVCDAQMPRRIPKLTAKRSEKETKKLAKTSVSKIHSLKSSSAKP